MREPVSMVTEGSGIFAICKDGSCWILPFRTQDVKQEDFKPEWVETVPIPGSHRESEWIDWKLYETKDKNYPSLKVIK